MSSRTRRSSIARVLFAALALVGCDSTDEAEVISAVLSGAEIYELDMLAADEGGAYILQQAQHFAVSEIRRDSSTAWNPRYVYVPAVGFTGNDRVELEVRSSSDGVSAPTRVRLISIRFTVRE